MEIGIMNVINELSIMTDEEKSDHHINEIFLNYYFRDIYKAFQLYYKTGYKNNVFNDIKENEFALQVAINDLHDQFDKTIDKHSFYMGQLSYISSMYDEINFDNYKYDIYCEFVKKSMHSKDILCIIRDNPGLNQKNILHRLNNRKYNVNDRYISTNYLSNILKKLLPFNFFYSIQHGNQKKYYLTAYGSEICLKFIQNESKKEKIDIITYVNFLDDKSYNIKLQQNCNEELSIKYQSFTLKDNYDLNFSEITINGIGENI